MAFWRTIPLQRQVEWAASVLRFANSGSVALPPHLTLPARRASLRQWTVVGVVSIVLGFFAIGAALLPSRWLPLAVLAALCPFVVAIIGNPKRFFLALILLDIPFALDANFDYRLDAEKLGALSGLNISVTTVSLVVLYVMWLGELLAKEQTLARPVVRPTLPLALYVAFTALSLIVAHDVQLSFYFIFMLVQTFFLFVYIVGTVRTQQDVLFIVTVLMVGLLLEGMIMVGSEFLGHGAGIVQWGWRNGGTIGAPNGAASYLSLLLGPAITLLLVQGAHVRRFHKRLAALAVCFGVPALLLTGSRGGWIALSVSGTIICLVAWRRGWIPKMAPFAVALVLLGALASIPIALTLPLPVDAISERLGAGENGRGPLIDLAWQMIRDNPWLGVGANDFGIMIKDYASPEFNGQWLYTVHNKYLLIWSESGIGALLAFLWFMGATIARGWRGVSRSAGAGPASGHPHSGRAQAFSPERNKPLALERSDGESGRDRDLWQGERFLSSLILGFTAGIIGLAIHMFADLFNDRAGTQLQWLVAALVIAMSSMAVGRDRGPRTEDRPAGSPDA